MGVQYEDKLLLADLRGRFANAQNRIAVSFDETETPGFGIIDFRLGIKPLKALSVGGAVLNILDKNFYEHLNQGFRNSRENGLIYESGRNATLYVKYRF